MVVAQVMMTGLYLELAELAEWISGQVHAACTRTHAHNGAYATRALLKWAHVNV